MIPPRYHIAMKLITKNADYSIRAMLFMAKKPGAIYSVAWLSSRLGIPGPYLRKLLQIMSNKGLLSSIKGKRGGFKLADGYRELSVSDILSAFNSDLKMTDCVIKGTVCPNKRTCPLRKQVNIIEKEVILKIRGIKLKHLMKGEKR